MTLIHIPSLTFTELGVVSMENFQRTCHASKERLPFPIPRDDPGVKSKMCPPNPQRVVKCD